MQYLKGTFTLFSRCDNSPELWWEPNRWTIGLTFERGPHLVYKWTQVWFLCVSWTRSLICQSHRISGNSWSLHVFFPSCSVHSSQTSSCRNCVIYLRCFSLWFFLESAKKANETVWGLSVLLNPVLGENCWRNHRILLVVGQNVFSSFFFVDLLQDILVLCLEAWPFSSIHRFLCT